ncbi:MAG: class III poly(R)-hydroxyalkanoic acid synthase subunit PhaE, partial [Anaerolineae bacterium]|nr:class III poly(R)-hydroxyalkanoic acid synthase subunit PhaE [Anaerolineae bacterium]
MDWTEQAGNMMNAWADAQRQWWENWQTVAGMSAETANPVEPAVRIFTQWQSLIQESMRGWTGAGAGRDPVMRQVADQFIASQSAMMKFVELLSNAWTDLAPRMAAGEDWQAALLATMNRVREQFTGTTGAAQDMGALWSLYMDEWGRLSRLWAEPFQRVPWTGAAGLTGTGGDLGDVIELTNLYWDAFEQSFGALLESPGLGYNRELNEKIAKGFDSWLDFRRASASYQAKLADVWAEAFEQLVREMADLAEKGKMVDSVRELMLLWGQVADRVFVETFRTDEYVRVQGEFLNAAMAYRIERRAIMEVLLNLYDLPTRSEVDEAHRNIYELRKEVKALKKQVAEQQKPKRSAAPRRKKAAGAVPAPAPES